MISAIEQDKANYIELLSRLSDRMRRLRMTTPLLKDVMFLLLVARNGVIRVSEMREISPAVYSAKIVVVSAQYLRVLDVIYTLLVMLAANQKPDFKHMIGYLTAYPVYAGAGYSGGATIPE